MIWQTSSRLTVRPASSPRTETLMSSSSSSTARRSAVPWRILSSSATWRLVCRPNDDVVGHVVPTDRQHPGVERRALLEEREIDRAGADVGDRHAELLLGLGQDGLGRGQRVGDELVDLDAGRGHALGQVLDGGRRGRDDVRLDLEAQGAHPERILDPFLAVDREAAPLDVEDLAVRGDRDRSRLLDGAAHVLAGDLAVVGGDGHHARGVEALDVLPADAHEGPVDLPAGQPLGALDRVRDGPGGLVDVDDDALLEPRRRHRPVAHDRQPAVATHLADEGADLARADVDADEDRFAFHHLVQSLPSRCVSRGNGAGSAPGC